MPLETFDKISDLDAANPPGTDLRSQGDDHVRGLKLTLRNIDPALKVGGLAQLGFPGHCVVELQSHRVSLGGVGVKNRPTQAALRP